MELILIAVVAAIIVGSAIILYCLYTRNQRMMYRAVEEGAEQAIGEIRLARVLEKLREQFALPRLLESSAHGPCDISYAGSHAIFDQCNLI